MTIYITFYNPKHYGKFTEKSQGMQTTTTRKVITVWREKKKKKTSEANKSDINFGISRQEILNSYD